MKKTVPQLLVVVLLALLSSNSVPAQNGQIIAAKNPIDTVPNHSASQTTLSALAALPEADTLIYINPQRILNEAAPRVMPEKDLAEMRQAFGGLKQVSGVDPSKLDYLVIAVRFRKPSGELNFNPPEFMAVAGGDFSADSLVMVAQLMAGDKLRDEKYASKTLTLMTIDPIAKEAEKNPVLKSLSEVGIVPLNATTIAVGTIGYLKAAVDAAAGNGRISSESLSSLLRDPNALISIAGSPLTSFSKSFGLLGTEANARVPRCDSRFGDFYAAVTMDAANFMLRGALNADNPDTATIIKGLVAGLVRQATSFVPDKTAQSALQNLSITAEDNEVVLRADWPQQMVVDFIKEQMKPTSTAKKPAKKSVTRKRKPGRKG